MKFWNIFRLRVGPDEAADVEPMKVEVDPAARPCIARNRRYTAEERKWLDNYVSRLVEFGLVRPNNNAQWAAAPLLVRKAGAAKYRLTFD